LQRLFTMFPGGWPGAGLLLLRVAAALPLLIGGSLELRGLPHSWGHAAQFIAVTDGVLLLAGFYQFSRLKDLCLTPCRSPMMFFLARWRDGPGGALYLGLRHGMHCVGCCWALMALMLLAGAMNIGWMAALTAVMLIEKTFSAGRAIGRAVGLVLVLCGSTLVGAALSKGDLL